MRFKARFDTLLKAIVQVKAHARKGKGGAVAQVKAHTRYVQSAAERKELIAKLAQDFAYGKEAKHKTAASALGLARHLSRNDKGATYHVARTEDGHHVVRKGEAPPGGDRIHVTKGKATLHRADGETRSLKHLKGPVWMQGEAVPYGLKAPEIEKWAQGAIDGKKVAESIVLAPVSPGRVEEINKEVGTDLRKMDLVIERSAVRHIDKKHGEQANEESRGQRAITAEDIAKIPDIVEHGQIIPDGDNSGHGGRVVIASQDGDRLVTVQEVRRGRKRLATVTLYSSSGAAEAAPDSGPRTAGGELSEESSAQHSTSETAFGSALDTPNVPPKATRQNKQAKPEKPRPEDVDLSHLSDDTFLREGVLKLSLEEGSKWDVKNGYRQGWTARGADHEGFGATEAEAKAALRQTLDEYRAKNGEYPSMFFQRGVPLHLLRPPGEGVTRVEMSDAEAASDPPQVPNTFGGMTLDDIEEHIHSLVGSLDQSTEKQFSHEGDIHFAQIKDGQGFSAFDFALVKAWRNTPGKTIEDYLAIAKVLQKYRRQLGDEALAPIHAFVKAASPSPGGGEQSIVPGTVWVLGNGKTDSNPPEVRMARNPDGTYSAKVKGGNFKETVEALKTAVPYSMRRHEDGLGWQPESKTWKMTAEGAQALLADVRLAHKAGLESSAHQALALDLDKSSEEAAKAEASAQAEAARVQAELDAKIKAGIVPAGAWRNREKAILASPPVFSIGGDAFEFRGKECYQLAFGYDPTRARNELAKACGAMWDQPNKRWALPVKNLPKALALIDDLGVSQAVFEKHAHLFSKSDSELLDRNANLVIHSKEDTSFSEPEGWSTHKMHDYQRKGASWLVAQKKGILAFGVGLGKTNISIAAACKVQEKNPRPVVCVVPGKRLYGWKNDIEAAMPGKKVLVLDQGPEARKKIIESGALEGYDFVVCTYAMNVAENHALTGLAPSAVIFDEAHKLKGAKTKQTQAGTKLSEASEHVWDLTATPMPNSPLELEQLIKRNHPSAIGKGADSFNQFYQWEGKKVVGIRDPEGLAAAIAPFVFTKRSHDPDVMLELPTMHEVRTHLTEWNTAQRAMYDEAKADIITFIEDLGQDPSAAERAKALVMMGKLDQIAISPALVDPNFTERSPKIQELCDQIEARQAEYPGKGHVVFCRYVEALDLGMDAVVKDGLFLPHEVATIRGDTNKQEVANIEKALNEGRIKAVFCSDAAMEGLNFQRGANHLVNLDTPWSPYFSEQRHGRVYRQGQKDPVRISTLAMADSIEARKAALWGRKDNMNRKLFGHDGHEVEHVSQGGELGDAALASRLSKQDLLDLLK